MNIYHLINNLSNGGAENMLLRYIRADNSDDYNHTVCHLGDSEGIRSRFTDNGIRVVNLKGNLITSPSNTVQLIRFFQTEPIDILHTHLPYSHIVGRVFARLSGINKIVSTHHNIAESRSYRGKVGNIEVLTRVLANKEIAVSASVKQTQLSYVKSDWSIIRNAIDVSGFAERVETANTTPLHSKYEINNKKALLNIGRYVPQKNQRILIQAMKNIVEHHPNVLLFIVGWGELENRLRSEVINNNLENHIVITGKVPCIEPYYSVASGYVSSSIYEGFSLTLIEALAAGLPIVTTNVKGSKEAVGGSAIIVDSQSAQALADGVIKLLDGKKKYSTSKIRDRANEFDISKYIEKHHELYDSL